MMGILGIWDAMMLAIIEAPTLQHRFFRRENLADRNQYGYLPNTMIRIPYMEAQNLHHIGTWCLLDQPESTPRTSSWSSEFFRVKSVTWRRGFVGVRKGSGLPGKPSSPKY